MATSSFGLTLGDLGISNIKFGPHRWGYAFEINTMYKLMRNYVKVDALPNVQREEQIDFINFKQPYLYSFGKRDIEMKVTYADIPMDCKEENSDFAILSSMAQYQDVYAGRLETVIPGEHYCLKTLDRWEFGSMHLIAMHWHDFSEDYVTSGINTLEITWMLNDIHYTSFNNHQEKNESARF